MEKIAYLGQPNCYRLSNGTVDVIVTTDIGPRVIRYGFIDGANVFDECPDRAVPTEWGEWKPWGGHRLWAAPEAMPRSYAPDNAPVAFHIESDRAIRLLQPTDRSGVTKELCITLDAEGTGVRVDHKITNHSLWEIELAPWALTVMRGGISIIPLEPYRSHDEALLPAQSIARWFYTDLTDPRWTMGKQYVRLRADATRSQPQKIGIFNKRGWCAHLGGRTLFVKRFGHDCNRVYPDQGCNNEAFVAGDYMEIESLGPLQRLRPNDSVQHVERWELHNDVAIGETEEELHATLHALLERA